MNIEGCAALENVDFSGNSVLTFDMPTDLVSKSINIDCEGQTLNHWEPSLSFNFDDFVQSPDVASSDNTASTSGTFRVSATKLTNVKNLKAYDINGNEIAVTSDENGNITFASTPYTMTYNYEIGDFNNTSMDVTVSAGDGSSSNKALSGSGGGCSLIRNEGLGIMNVLILLLFLLAPLKIKKI